MSVNEKLEQAIAAIKRGDKSVAITMLHEVIQDQPHNEAAWLWLAAAEDDSDKKREYLEKTLEINPHSDTAKQGLAKLGPAVELPDFGAPSSPARPTSEKPREPDRIKVEPHFYEKVQNTKARVFVWLVAILGILIVTACLIYVFLK